MIITIESSQTLTAFFDLLDATPPTITLSGAATINLQLGATFSDPGATATDDVEGDISTAIQSTGQVDTAVLGTYILTYTVSDTAGNSASVTRTVHVNEAVPLIYFENAICKCPEAWVGYTETIDEITYTVVMIPRLPEKFRKTISIYVPLGLRT